MHSGRGLTSEGFEELIQRYVDPEKRAEVKEHARRLGMQTIYKGMHDRQQIKNSISMEKRKRKIKRKEREKMEKMKDELTGVKTIKSDSSEGFFTESSESS